MSAKKTISGKEAVAFLRQVFSGIDPAALLRVRLSGVPGERKVLDFRARVGMAGFSEERRKRNGSLDTDVNRTGALSLYGEDQPDHSLLIEVNGTVTVFLLSDVKVRIAGVADNAIEIGSTSWKKASSVFIFLRNIYADGAALTFFTKVLLPRLNNGEYTARLGKWASKKVYDRSVPREKAERLSIADYLRKPEEDSLKTTHIGSDIQSFEFTQGAPDKGLDHSLKARHTFDSSTLKFAGMIVENETPGKEIGTRQATSTYIYLVGTPYHAPVNLIIIRHRPKKKS